MNQIFLNENDYASSDIFNDISKLTSVLTQNGYAVLVEKCEGRYSIIFEYNNPFYTDDVIRVITVDEWDKICKERRE